MMPGQPTERIPHGGPPPYDSNMETSNFETTFDLDGHVETIAGQEGMMCVPLFPLQIQYTPYNIHPIRPVIPYQQVISCFVSDDFNHKILHELIYSLLIEICLLYIDLTTTLQCSVVNKRLDI